MHNLYKELPSFANEEKWELNVVIEIVRGSNNKIEYNEDLWYFALDRTLHQSTFYPFDYGFIPQTSAWDGDGIDVCLLTTYPLFPWCVVKCRPIGMLSTIDQDGEDYKLFAVPVTKLDPRFEEIKTIDDLPAHVKEEYSIFFKEYKRLEKNKYDKITIGDWISVDAAYEHIKEAQVRFEENHK